MDWKKGFSAAYYMTIIDRDTWRDIERIEITGGSVSRTDSNLMESADINCVKYDKGEQWVRLYLDAKQNGANVAHTALFTGLATSPASDINGQLITNSLECYSVLKPADDVPVKRGYFVAQKSDVPYLIKNELLTDTPAPIVIDGQAPTLQKMLLAENNETKLSMAIKLLTAINWRFRITGDGTIHICPKEQDPVASFDALETDVVEPQISVEYDWFKCPNVFMAVIDGVTYTARDDDPNSPLSVINRGREIWKIEESPALNTGETATQYVKRRLKETQTAVMKVSYNRRYYPDITVGDRIKLNYPAQGITGTFQITSDNFSLNYGATVNENANRIGA